MEKKNNLILDLDDTLIHTESVKSIDNLNENNHIILPNFIGKVHFRKYLKEFLDFCYKNFNVSIWTSSNSLYCKEILKLILNEEQYNKTKLILISEDDKIINLKTNRIYKNDYSRWKPLNFIFEDSELSLYFKKENTILLDNEDFIKKFNKENTLLISNFNIESIDQEFCYISKFLNNLKYSDNIPDVIKTSKTIKFDCSLLTVNI
jgi:TFIIF-interacting CTD phosphatase-like protein